MSSLGRRLSLGRHFKITDLGITDFILLESQHILSTTLRRHRFRFLKSSFLALSIYNHEDVNPKSFGYDSGMKNYTFNAIKEFKTNVTRSQVTAKTS